MLNKNRFVGIFALPAMSRFDPPKADDALLGLLVGVLSLVSNFVLCMHWLPQPTVVANAGAGAFEKEISIAVLLPSRSIIDEIEQSEIEAALLENESQGLQSVAFARHEPQTDPTPKLAEPSPQAPKSKRVVRVQRPHPVPSAQDAWAFAPVTPRSFGTFGSWSLELTFASVRVPVKCPGLAQSGHAGISQCPLGAIS